MSNDDIMRTELNWTLVLTEQECRQLQILLFQCVRTIDVPTEIKCVLEKVVNRGM